MSLNASSRLRCGNSNSSLRLYAAGLTDASDTQSNPADVGAGCKTGPKERRASFQELCRSLHTPVGAIKIRKNG